MSKASMLISSLAAAALAAVLTYWMWEPNQIGEADPKLEPRQSGKPNAIANKWQWDNFTSKPTSASEPEQKGEEAADDAESAETIPYDVILIYNILQDIQLDDNGRVVPDQTAKYALERGFDDLGPNVSPEAMSELQDLIRIGLPGDAGEEAARIMQTYYDYRLAEEEFNRQLQERVLDEEAAPSAESYEQLVQLRRRYLGEELAVGLFAVEELQARHIYSTIAIQQNEELSDEDKEVELEALQSRLNERLMALGELTPEEVAAQEVERLRQGGASAGEIYSARQAILGPIKAQELAAADREEAQWQSHFDGFWRERQHIMRAYLNEEDRQRQVEDLLSQYFNPEDQERARLTSLQRQSQERAQQ